MEVLSGVIWFGSVAVVVACSILMSRAVGRFLPLSKGGIGRCGGAMLFMIPLYMPSWIGDENPLYLLPVFLLGMLFCYGGEKSARLVMGMVLYTLLVSVNMTLDSSVFLDRLIPLVPVANPLIFVKAGVYLLLWIMVARNLPDGEPMHLSGKLWGLIGLLGTAPLFAALSFSLWNTFHSYREMSREEMGVAYVILPFTAISAGALLIAVVVLSRQEELERKSRLAQLREVYYEGIRQEQIQIRRVRHDMNNHLTALQGLLEGNHTEKAIFYLRELSRRSEEGGAATRISGNETANIVISAKKRRMEQQGIRFEIQAALPEKLSVTDVDLCALIGNALDNAAEAAALAADRWVSLKIKYEKGMLMIQVENSFGSDPIPEGAGFCTTKQDKNAHGFGLKSMQEITERYQGFLQTKAEEEKFELLAGIPC